MSRPEDEHSVCLKSVAIFMKKALCFLGVAVSLALAAPNNETSDCEQEGQIWAVLVAPSYGFHNYRHQADICHAYQIFHSNGVPDSNIIVMMYDDIAYDSQNPFPGKLFNKPHGPDVYHGVKKDYTWQQVTPKNFIRVLTGSKKAKGKVLESGPNDHVFINFVDHGGTGLISFSGDRLYADTLIKALKKMHKKKMYKKLVFYLESCMSGSMFDNILPKDINVLAITAARPNESSYSTYCGKNSGVGTCLGDEFSVNWMEDIDNEKKEGKYTKETLLEQFELVKHRVKNSKPQEYGDTTNIPNEKVDEYLGVPKKNYTNKDIQSCTYDSKENLVISSWEIAVHYLNNKINNTTNKHERKVLLRKKHSLLQGRKSVDHLFRAILSHVTELDIPMVKELEDTRPELSLEMMPCYRTIVERFNENCVNISKNTYALRHLYKFANLCLSQYSEEDVLQALSDQCKKSHRKLMEIH